MTIEQVILIILTGIGSIWAVFKVILPRFVDAKIRADEYERARSAFREDKTFEMLEDTLEHWKSARAEERQDALANRKIQSDLIDAINKMSANIDKSSANIDRQTDTIRILTQEVSTISDRLRVIENKIEIKENDNRRY